MIRNDADKDGVIDASDRCPNTPKNTQVDRNGCSVAQLAPPDADGDGVHDGVDLCPNERGRPNAHGCPDADRDGVRDSLDRCLHQPGAPDNGCPDNDGDQDGVGDRSDHCPGTPRGLQVDRNGCQDSDEDGIPDNLDPCPNEAVPGDPYSCRH